MTTTTYRAGEAPEAGNAYRVTKLDKLTARELTGEQAESRLVSEREALGRFLGAFEQSSHRDNLVAALKSGRPLFVIGWRVEFVGWGDLSSLTPGDVLTLRNGSQRIVVKVIDATGAIGGLVDTKALDGRYSRSAGFVAGRDIVAVTPAAAVGTLGKVEALAAGWPR